MSQQPYSDRLQPFNSNISYRTEPPGANSYPAVHDGIRSNAIKDSVFTSNERSKFLMERNAKLSSENERLSTDLHALNAVLLETRQEATQSRDDAQQLHQENIELRRLLSASNRVPLPQPHQQINQNLQYPQLATSMSTESYNDYSQQSINSNVRSSMAASGSGDRAGESDMKTLKIQVKKQSQEIQTLKSTLNILVTKIRRTGDQPQSIRPLHSPPSNGAPQPLLTRLSSSLSISNIEDLNIEDIESTNVQPTHYHPTHGTRPKTGRPIPPPRPSADGTDQFSHPQGLTLTEHPSRPDIVMSPYQHLNMEPFMMANDETLRSVSMNKHVRPQTESMELQINTPIGSSVGDSLEAAPQLEPENPLLEDFIQPQQYKNCPTCRRKFNVTSENDKERFEDHALSCLDEVPGEFPASIHVEEDRTCPMCHLHFPQTITQTDFENHVISHFEDDDGRQAGFEMVGSAVK